MTWSFLSSLHWTNSLVTFSIQQTDCICQCVCPLIRHGWSQNVVWTKKLRLIAWMTSVPRYDVFCALSDWTHWQMESVWFVPYFLRSTFLDSRRLVINTSRPMKTRLLHGPLFTPYIVFLRTLLFSHCESTEEGTRNVVAECLGKLTLVDPLRLLPLLKVCTGHNDHFQNTLPQLTHTEVSSRPHLSFSVLVLFCQYKFSKPYILLPWFCLLLLLLFLSKHRRR